MFGGILQLPKRLIIFLSPLEKQGSHEGREGRGNAQKGERQRVNEGERIGKNKESGDIEMETEAET